MPRLCHCCQGHIWVNFHRVGNIQFLLSKLKRKYLGVEFVLEMDVVLFVKKHSQFHQLVYSFAIMHLRGELVFSYLLWLLHTPGLFT